MISREQLESINYRSIDSDPDMYSMFGSWEYGFEIKTQSLYFLNDGFGEPEFLAEIKDFEKLKDILDFYGEL